MLLQRLLRVLCSDKMTELVLYWPTKLSFRSPRRKQYGCGLLNQGLTPKRV